MMTALKMLLVFTFLTGLVYPIFVTGVSQILFHSKANGSLLLKGDKVIGSELIGQNFTADKYFQSRPSAVNYDPQSSGASNLSVTSKKFQESLKLRRERFNSDVMLTASGSGLDPHITTEAALEQIDRILAARGLTSDRRGELTQLITVSTEGKTLGFMGQERINVLKLNLTLDESL
jgi:potassium-transporting ATPase KdpC subunit